MFLLIICLLSTEQTEPLSITAKTDGTVPLTGHVWRWSKLPDGSPFYQHMDTGIPGSGYVLYGDTWIYANWTEITLAICINETRTRHGLPALIVDSRLMQSARKHCAWMVRARRLEHTAQPVAENIALGQTSAAEAVSSWLNSPGHRANLLGRYSRVGVTAYTGQDGRAYWCMQLSR